MKRLFKYLVLNFLLLLANEGLNAEGIFFSESQINWNLFYGDLGEYSSVSEQDYRTINLPFFDVYAENGETPYSVVILSNEIPLRNYLDGDFLYLSLGKLYGAVQIYLNGSMISQRGEIDPYVSYRYAETGLLKIPVWSLKTSGNDELLFRIAGKDKQLHIDNIEFLSESEFKSKSLAAFLNQDLYLYYSVCMLVIFIYFLFFSISIKRERLRYLYYACSSFLFALYFFHIGNHWMVKHFTLFYSSHKSALFPAVCLTALFFIEEYKVFRSKWIKWILYSFSLLSILIMNIGVGSPSEAESRFRHLLIPLALVMIFVFSTIIMAYLKSQKKTLYVIIPGSLIAITLGSHDIIFQMLGIPPLANLQGAGILLLNLAILLSRILETTQLEKELFFQRGKIVQMQSRHGIELKNRQNETLQKIRKKEALLQKQNSYIQYIAGLARIPLNGLNLLISYVNPLLPEQHLNYIRNRMLKEEEIIKRNFFDITMQNRNETLSSYYPKENFPLKTILTFLQEIHQRLFETKCIHFHLDKTVPVALITQTQLLLQTFFICLQYSLSRTEKSIDCTITHTKKTEKTLLLYFSFSFRLHSEEKTTVSGFSSSTPYGLASLYPVLTLLGSSLENTVKDSVEKLNFAIPMEVGAIKTNPADNLPMEAPPTVLLISEYLPLQTILTIHFQELGYTVKGCSSVEGGIKELKSGSFKWILIDLDMNDQRLDVWINRIRTQIDPLKTFLIGVVEDPESIYFDFTPLFNEIIPKPVRRRRIEQLINQKEYKLKKGKNKRNPLRYKDFLKEIDQNEELARIILEGFIKGTQKQMKNIKKLVLQEDFTTLHREFHTIKGGALNIMADDLFVPASQLSDKSKMKMNNPHYALGPLDSLIDELNMEFERLRSYLEEIIDNIDFSEKE